MTFLKLIRHTFYRFRLMPLTSRKIDGYYLWRDTSSLLMAVEIAPWYLKKQVIHYLGEIGGMKVYRKLFSMLQKEKKLELELFAAIMNIVLRHPEEIPDEDSLYLHSKLDLLDQLYPEPDQEIALTQKKVENYTSSSKSPPIIFDPSKGLFGNRREPPIWITDE